jgi:hypothetical protein
MMDKNIKRYLLFEGDAYETGGWDRNFQGTYDTIEEAFAEANKGSESWWDIVDLQTLETVDTKQLELDYYKKKYKEIESSSKHGTGNYSFYYNELNRLFSLITYLEDSLKNGRAKEI